jgi:ribose transport system ATP-binding protein
LTVLENVMLGQESTRFGVLQHEQMKDQVVRALIPLTSAADRARLTPAARLGDLPVAAQQLVEIARALVRRGGCRLLILDEPTSSLGRDDTQRLFDVIRSLCADGVTVLYISHFLEEVAQIADRFTVLRDGVTVGTGAVADVPMQDIVHMMAGRRIEQLFSRSHRTPGEVVLQVDALQGEPQPRHASFALRAGEVFGIGGLVGAGRTELLRTIFGLAPVRKGSVRVKALVGTASPCHRLAQGVGLLSEDRKGEGLAATMSVADNISLSRLPVGPFHLLLPSNQRRVASKWIASLGIKVSDPEQPVASLSGGNQQKVALARLLHHGADVLLLDEPTRGIDVGSKAQVYQLIDKLACEGKAVLMVSSYVPELLGMCDRIAVMYRGRLGEPRPASQWTEATLLQEATGARA